MRKTAIFLPIGSALLIFAIILTQRTAFLEAGSAKIDISPQAGDSIYNMSGELMPVDGRINDSLFAKALYLKSAEEKVLVLSLDLIGLENSAVTQLKEAVEKATGIDNVVLTVTHVHASGFYRSEQMPYLQSQLIEVSKAAMQNPKEVKLGYAEDQLEEGYNRRIVDEKGQVTMLWSNPDRLPSTEKTDNAVGVISLQAKDGSQIATLVNYTVHPVITMSFANHIVSAGYPGAMASQVEKELGGTCFFFLGAAGDINPYMAGIDENNFENMHELSNMLSDVVLNCQGQIEHEEAQELQFAAIKEVYGKRNDTLTTTEVELAALLLDGHIAMATLPGEFFVDFGIELKKRLEANTFVLGYANQSLGYVPTKKALKEGGYGATEYSDVEETAGYKILEAQLEQLNKLTNTN